MYPLGLFAIEKIKRLSCSGATAEQIQMQMELFYPLDTIRLYMQPMTNPANLYNPNQFQQYAYRKAVYMQRQGLI